MVIVCVCWFILYVVYMNFSGQWPRVDGGSGVVMPLPGVCSRVTKCVWPVYRIGVAALPGAWSGGRRARALHDGQRYALYLLVDVEGEHVGHARNEVDDRHDTSLEVVAVDVVLVAESLAQLL